MRVDVQQAKDELEKKVRAMVSALEDQHRQVVQWRNEDDEKIGGGIRRVQGTASDIKDHLLSLVVTSCTVSRVFT